MNDIVIRNSTAIDLNDIARIYSHEVLTGTSTYETTPPSIEELSQRRDALLKADFPYLVACLDDKLLAYAYAGPYRMRTAYRNTVENSVYVDKDARQLGVGKLVLKELISHCERGPWQQMVAVIGDSSNTQSIALHNSLGFRTVGTLEGVGYKFDRCLDSVLMQRALG